MNKEELKEVREHFRHCIDEGLTIGETEERLLQKLYTEIELLNKETQWLYGRLNLISQIIEQGREKFN